MDNLKGLGAALPGQKGGGKKGGGNNEAGGASSAASKAAAAAAELSSNPAALGALQDKLDRMVGKPSGYLDDLPPQVKRRLAVLKDLQEKHDELQEQFEEEKRALEAKFHALYQPLYADRAAVITGEKAAPPPAAGEPADPPYTPVADTTQGIPEFWLGAMRNHEVIAEQITEKDEPALRFLQNITWTSLTPPPGALKPVKAEKKPAAGTEEEEEEEDDDEPKGYRLDFHFAANPHFSNGVLSVTYHMLDEDDPILERIEGTTIAWAAGKDTTVKLLKKKPKKGAKSQKPVTKTEECESFFRFFAPPAVPDEGDEELEDEEAEQLQEQLEMHFEIGTAFKEKIIPRAVAWYTGEALDDDDDDDDYDPDEEDDDGEEGFDDDEEGDDDDDDDDDEEEERPQKGRKAKGQPPAKKGGGGGGKAGPMAAGATAGEQPECKQQ